MNPQAGPPTRVLVLGFDGGSPDLLRRWTADGSLPNLRRLMARGLMGNSETMEGFIHSTWPSFCTGSTTARHGFHYVAQLIPGSYDYHLTPIRCPPFWSHLSRAGRRTAIFDMPMLPPDSEINGMHVVDWGAIEFWTHFRTVPDSLRSQILADWGPHPLGAKGDDLRTTLESQQALLDALRTGARTRADMSCKYLAQGGWDVFLHMFPEAHCAGHHQWHLHDPNHPSYDPQIAAGLGDPIRLVYQELDASMGRVIDAAGDAIVIVISGHGMAHWFGGEFILHEILFRLGAAERLPGPPPQPTRQTVSRAQALWRMLPLGLRERVFDMRRRMQLKHKPAPHTQLPLPKLRLDPARSRCLLVRNGHLTAGIRLNLKGREPAGVLSPGPEADQYVAELSADLLAIVDERTGRPFVRSVKRTRDLYQGPNLDVLPDLIVEWNDTLPVGNTNIAEGAGAAIRVRSPKLGVLEVANNYTRTGDHRDGGFFIAAGPGIPHGELERSVSVMDFAPTICKVLGVDLPDVDGRPIPELLNGSGRTSPESAGVRTAATR